MAHRTAGSNRGGYAAVPSTQGTPPIIEPPQKSIAGLADGLSCCVAQKLLAGLIPEEDALFLTYDNAPSAASASIRKKTSIAAPSFASSSM